MLRAPFVKQAQKCRKVLKTMPQGSEKNAAHVQKNQEGDDPTEMPQRSEKKSARFWKKCRRVLKKLPQATLMPHRAPKKVARTKKWRSSIFLTQGMV